MSESPGTGTGTTSFDAPEPASPGAPENPGPNRRGKVLTVLIGVLLVAAVAATATVVILTHRQHHVQAPAHPLRGTIFLLRPGQCINSALNGTAVAHVVSCTQAHDAQIYGIVPVAGGHWPGAAVLSKQARQGCQSKLNAYLNQQLPPVNVTEFYVYPDRGAWDAGGHSVICEIRGIQGRLTGPVRAASG
jgi:Septum formation